VLLRVEEIELDVLLREVARELLALPTLVVPTRTDG
jgi:hypothetical protein